MRVEVFANEQQLAWRAAEYVQGVLTESARPSLGVATGSTPLALYARLRELYRAGQFSLAGGCAFALDEYLGLSAQSPDSYRYLLERELVGSGGVGLLAANLHTPDALAADPAQAAAAYEQQLRDIGGVDLQILGIGSNGHIGFNEPGAVFSSVTRVEQLAESTRADNARFFDGVVDHVPEFAITQGLSTIMSAKRIMLLAVGAAKAQAVAALVAGEPTTKWPATVLQTHSNVLVLTDEAAISLATRRK